MFSPTTSTDILTLRPGSISGIYPQREECEQDMLERSLNHVQGILGHITPWSDKHLRKFACEVAACGDELEHRSMRELSMMATGLRRKLGMHGLADQVCSRSFALIRELSARTLGMRHYDTQIMTGLVLLQGMLAEMETGEGKSLAATLAAGTAALAGIPVHVITVNEYLVKRDAGLMMPLYKALGLSVGFVIQSMTHEERQAAYGCDITYCTSKQVAFDYLRDRLISGSRPGGLRFALASACNGEGSTGRFLLRGLCLAIIDEADSVLIDDARTPLIITKEVDNSEEKTAYEQALYIARRLKKGRHFFIDTVNREVHLTLTGQQRLDGIEISQPGAWYVSRRLEELVHAALYALYLLQRDRDYIVRNGEVMLIDANTGRIMQGRSWERGLQQLVEIKEQCRITGGREVVGRLTFQRFFRRYMRLSGMTGTASEAASELWSVYRLRIRRIPLKRPCRRKKLPAMLMPSAKEKWKNVISAVMDLNRQGRPVLIGTASVAESELLSRMLHREGILHRVLNAKQDSREARIIAEAGRRFQVTVATNMAGRGTDIKLSEEVVRLGGLHVIAACCNSGKRIERQLFGRCARQGDPGSCQSIISLEDDIIQDNYPVFIINILRHYTMWKCPFHRQFNRLFIMGTYWRMKRRHRQARIALLHYEQRTCRILAFSGNFE